jgi:potassium/hydrogen antiporter
MLPAVAEPIPTALFLLTLGALLAASALFARASSRVHVPVALVFLLVGMLAGEEGIGRVPFADFRFTYRVGITALVLILFDGGLNTPSSMFFRAIRPAGVLATVGVAATAVLVAVIAHALGLDWPAAFLLGAIVSSTDAAAVFSVLRGSGISLKRRVGATLEVESGLNDPLAVILTVLLTQNLVSSVAFDWQLVLSVAQEFTVGAAAGLVIGKGGGALLGFLRFPQGGLYPAFTLSLAFLSYGAATLLHGSGFLAVYLAGIVLGTGHLPVRASILRVHDAAAWLGQIVMFLLLGLLVTPSRLLPVAAIGLAVAIALAVVIRPVVVMLCLLPFRYPWRESMYIGWTGLRGAVPVILATYPVLTGAPGSQRIFEIVFFIAAANALLPGATIKWATRKLELEADEPPRAPAVLEIESIRPLNGELLSFYIDEALGLEGTTIADLPFPTESAVTLIVRGQTLIAPKGHTMLEIGDHVYVLARPEDRDLVHLMFGRPTTE